MAEEEPPLPQRSEGRGDDAPEPRNPLPFMIFAIVLSVIGFFIVRWMVNTTKIQDCVMSGRKNCEPLDPALER